MKIDVNTDPLKSDFIKLKDEQWLNNQRIAGKVAAGALSLLENLVKNKTTKSLIELDKIAEEYIIENRCTPTFLRYKGFPNSVCISVNNQLVHGIPTDYKLKEGDVVSFDLGATYNGSIGDTAITCVFGEPKSKEHIKGIEIANLCLSNAIAAISIGKRLGVIGNAIYKTARNNGFNVIEHYGGHGICSTKNNIGIPHASPFVSNKSKPDEGIRIVSGMTLAIEPLLIPFNYSTETKVGADGWTVYTKDVSFHTEHTIFINENGVEIITRRENEKI